MAQVDLERTISILSTIAQGKTPKAKDYSMSEPDFAKFVLDFLYKEGYIENARFNPPGSESPYVVVLSQVIITDKGVRFLNLNSLKM